MNDYEARQEARRQRYEERAERARAESERRYKSAMGRLDGIPPGQPILVGHHSERGHRAALRRHDNDMRAAVDADKRAGHYAAKAAGVGTGGISSDDPEAVAKLREELAKAEAVQVAMRECNKAVRARLAGKIDAAAYLGRLRAAHPGMTEAAAAKLLEPDFAGRTGFAGFELSNNGANIRRIKARIAELERKATTPARGPVEGDGFRIVEDIEDNRVRVFFDAKPPAELRQRLKACGFRWSRYAGAWQRHASNAAWWGAHHALGLKPE